MNSPLLKAITEHNNKNRASFHMPAHKGGADCLAPLAGVLNLDMTEIPDTGSLFDGEGATAEAEALAAGVFGTAGSFMSAGGCTLCIQAMLRLAAPNGGKIICGRVIHRAAANAMALLDLTPVWVMPDHSAGEGITGRITAEGVAAALKENPQAQAVYITTPDYFGVMSDITAISAEAKKFGVPVIVDNAHGAHLPFLDKSLSPLVRGAAMSADSAHKTLPVLTGGAWLNIADEKYLGEARSSLSLFGSTSPSYLIMLSLDLCREWLSEAGAEELKKLAGKVEMLKSFVKQIGFTLPSGECDPLRLAVNTGFAEINGTKAGELLRSMKIEPEYAGRGSIIFIPSPFNTDKEFNQLQIALQELSKHNATGKNTGRFLYRQSELPEMVITPRQSLLARTERVGIEKSAGRIAAEAVCHCPPAIPAVMPGERITLEIMEILSEYGIINISVVK